MNWPRSLNPFRGTSFSRLLPFTWAVIKHAAIAAPFTVEVFFHHRFGSRSGLLFFKGFLLLLVVSALQSGYPPAVVPLFPSFLFAYTIAAIGQWLSSRLRPFDEQIHSYYGGEPWPLWRRVPMSVTKIQRYLEPALCYLVACLLKLFDPALGHWLCLAAVALFIKGQVFRVWMRTGQLDALDSRIEARWAAPRRRDGDEPFVEARIAPPPRDPG